MNFSSIKEGFTITKITQIIKYLVIRHNLFRSNNILWVQLIVNPQIQWACGVYWTPTVHCVVCRACLTAPFIKWKIFIRGNRSSEKGTAWRPIDSSEAWIFFPWWYIQKGGNSAFTSPVSFIIGIQCDRAKFFYHSYTYARYNTYLHLTVRIQITQKYSSFPFYILCAQFSNKMWVLSIVFIDRFCTDINMK